MSKAKVRDTKCLKNWVSGKNYSKEEEKQIIKIIKVFSEFLVCTNSDYLYNKTYLNSFVGDFIECRKQLKKRLSILKTIKKQIVSMGVDLNEVIIKIDNMWMFENGEIKLSNVFDIHNAKSNNIKYELQYIGEKGFAIANEMNLSGCDQQKLDNDLTFFEERWKEVSSKDEL